MKPLIYVAVGVGLAVAGYAAADYKRQYDEDRQYAETLRVSPVKEEIVEPREECKDVLVTKYVKDRGNDTTGTVVGALVGGALGNQVGGGSGRKAATVAGLVGGGLIGRRIDENNNPPKAVQTTQRQCRTVEDRREEVVAYDVEYRYRGEIHTARMAQDPGPRWKVRETKIVEPELANVEPDRG